MVSKKDKIIGSIVGVVLLVGVLGSLAIGGLLYFVRSSRIVAQQVYGGPLPAMVMPVMGMTIKPHRLAVYMDMNHHLAMVVFQSPPQAAQTPLPFSEPDVKKALEQYDDSRQIQNALQGTEGGKASTLTLGSQVVHTLKYTDASSKQSEMGILNLDNSRLLFVATMEGTSPAASQAVAQFLSQMAVVANDSHMKAEAAPTPSPSGTPSGL